jgi:hypothetical protein
MLRQRLALGAVPVATRIVVRLPMTAAAAQLYVPAESGGAACGERRQHLSLLRGQVLPRISVDVIGQDIAPVV